MQKRIFILCIFALLSLHLTEVSQAKSDTDFSREIIRRKICRIQNGIPQCGIIVSYNNFAFTVDFTNEDGSKSQQSVLAFVNEYSLRSAHDQTPSAITKPGECGPSEGTLCESSGDAAKTTE